MQRANKMTTTEIEELFFSVNLRRTAGEDEISQIKKKTTRGDISAVSTRCPEIE